MLNEQTTVMPKDCMLNGIMLYAIMSNGIMPNGVDPPKRVVIPISLSIVPFMHSKYSRKNVYVNNYFLYLNLPIEHWLTSVVDR